MTRPRVSIAGLMATVLIVAVGFAGLRTATLLWASAVFTLTVTSLATASLGATASRGRPRIACLGFSIFGWVYLLATFGFWPGTNGVSAPPFLTKTLLDAAQPASNTAATMTIDPGPGGEMFGDSPLMVTTPLPGNRGTRTAPFAGRVVNLLHYRRIGHSLAAVAFAVLGGMLGTLFSVLSEAGAGRRLTGQGADLSPPAARPASASSR